MQNAQRAQSAAHRVSQIVADAGGKIVGRTRLQKTAYLLELTGLGTGFTFEYKHFGPYSEHVSIALRTADLIGLLSEKEVSTQWGGFYSIYEIEPAAKSEFASPVAEARKALLKLTTDADPVELELAATALFLHQIGFEEPWEETKARKPSKATEHRLSAAKKLYRSLCKVKAPRQLPKF